MPVEPKLKEKQLSEIELGSLVCFGSPLFIGIVFNKNDFTDTKYIAVLKGPREYLFRWVELSDTESCFDFGTEWSMELTLTDEIGIACALKKDEPGFVSVGRKRAVMNFLAPPESPSSGSRSICLSDGMPARVESGSTSFGSWKLWPSSWSPERRFQEPLAVSEARTR